MDFLRATVRAVRGSVLKVVRLQVVFAGTVDQARVGVSFFQQRPTQALQRGRGKPARAACLVAVLEPRHGGQ